MFKKVQQLLINHSKTLTTSLQYTSCLMANRVIMVTYSKSRIYGSPDQNHIIPQNKKCSPKHYTFFFILWYCQNVRYVKIVLLEILFLNTIKLVLIDELIWNFADTIAIYWTWSGQYLRSIDLYLRQLFKFSLGQIYVSHLVYFDGLFYFPGFVIWFVCKNPNIIKMKHYDLCSSCVPAQQIVCL